MPTPLISNMSTLIVELKELNANGENREDILTHKLELKSETLTFQRQFEAMGMRRNFLLFIDPQTGNTTVCISQGAPRTEYPERLETALCNVTMCIPKGNNATITVRDHNILYYVLLYRID